MQTITNKIIEIAKNIPHSTKTETKSYPIKNKIPKNILKKIGIQLEKETDFSLIVEIQFDTEKVILQNYTETGENYDDFYSYYIKQLPYSFKKWIFDNVRENKAK